ncbi:MAG: hypothetical protein KJO85_09330 [Gammaproteobacteria bacterium]|nr:hypothetical protein [Gammaproteobacteria bacterium]
MKRVSASRAFSWIADGFGLMRSQFYRLLLIGLILQFLTGFAQAGPLGLLFILAVPALTAGVLQAMHMVSRDGVPPVMTLFVAFQSSRKLLRLFMLGFVMLIAGFLAAGGALSGALESMDPELLGALERGDLKTLQSADPQVIQRLAGSLLAGLAVSGLLAYFAIPLLWFSGLPLGRALVSGLAGIIFNLPAFLLLVVGMVLLAMPVGLLLSLLFANAAGSTIMTLLMLLVIVTYQLLFLGVQYFAFRDIFGIDGGAAEDRDPEGQLLA